VTAVAVAAPPASSDERLLTELQVGVRRFELVLDRALLLVRGLLRVSTLIVIGRRASRALATRSSLVGVLARRGLSLQVDLWRCAVAVALMRQFRAGRCRR
jgi:hypothetical protein